MKKIFFIVFICLISAGCVRTNQPADLNLTKNNDQNFHESEEVAKIKSQEDELENQINLSQDLQPEIIKLPATLDNKVQFASQAPLANWELPYQEACEEASMITVSYFFEKNDLTSEKMDEEIKKLVDWEIQYFNTYTDTNAQEVAKIIEKYFGLQVEIIEEVTVESIKKELAKGNLIIAPFAGRMLGNPNFTEPGPLFHMLVIRGYDRNEFITNDVGTRKGEGYKYDYNVLLEAIHDLPMVDGQVFRPYDRDDYSDGQKEQLMTQGKKLFLSIKP